MTSVQISFNVSLCPHQSTSSCGIRNWHDEKDLFVRGLLLLELKKYLVIVVPIALQNRGR